MFRKKILISSLLMLTLSLNVVSAHSTIYTDEIGRLHFLGKDPGSAKNMNTNFQNFGNSQEKDLTNVMFKTPSFNDARRVLDESKPDSTTTTKKKEPKTKGRFTYNQNGLDANNPFRFDY